MAVHLNIEEILNFYRSGLTIGKIADLLSTSDQTINRRLRDAGETIRTIRRKGPYLERRKPVDMDRVREMRDAGMTTRAMGSVLGVSDEVVRDRMIEAGIPRLPTSFPGELNPAWKGGRTIDDDGYVMLFLPDHPNATSNGYVREHRIVMEKKLGRFLLPTEVVHHIDGTRNNNDPENLELFSTNADHLRSTLKGCVPKWTEDGKRRIRDGHPSRRAERESILIPPGTGDPS